MKFRPAIQMDLTNDFRAAKAGPQSKLKLK